MRQHQLIWYRTIYDDIKLLFLSFSFKLIVTFSMFITFNMPRDNVNASIKFAFTQKCWCLRKFDIRNLCQWGTDWKCDTIYWAVRNRDTVKWYQIKTYGLSDLADRWDLDFGRILERIFVNFCKLIGFGTLTVLWQFL